MAEGTARFLTRIGRLKFLPRTGWLDRGVPLAETESVADHSFRTALLAWLVAGDDPALDRDRVLRLALIHDLAEAVIGDLTPYEAADLPDVTDIQARRAFFQRRQTRTPERQAAKRAAEDAAMADLLADLPDSRRVGLAALWHELTSNSTPEAQFVHQVDKLETYLQSREYLSAAPDRPMDSFAAEVLEVMTHPVLVALRDAMGEPATK